MLNNIEQISPSMLGAFEKCRLKFVLDSNARRGKGKTYEFNPNSFMGTLIHKVLENYYNETYDLKLFDRKWEASFLELSKKVHIDKKDVDVLEYIKYWVSSYYPKKLNTLKTLNNYALLTNGIVYPEKKVRFKNVYGVVDLYEISDDKIRITDFKTGIIFTVEDGVNVSVKETYIEQLKTYGYIIYNTEKVKAENIELVIKGLGNNEIFSFRCSEEEYITQGLKIDNLIKTTNQIINSESIDNLASPEPNICNFCDHLFKCNSLHQIIKSQPENWDRIVLLKSINVKFNSKDLSINIVVNDRTISIHNIPENDFTEIKKMNELGKEVLLTNLFQVYNSNIKRWSKLTRYREA
ncbi:PD-(D/E)XK nuclease family protein [Polaribacter sp. 20A6]|uniref:PD-(D/E)XK nuclease family protein n=1 Tax=Polaribacter sp. 20A6 TaxID=2687289 RepID=UPI0013FE009A|nr:PD-(D/E)XK nuclease family protein [Polaribacter sp. 20A6]